MFDVRLFLLSFKATQFNIIKSCCHPEKNILSSRLLSKNIKNKIYRTIILRVVLYGYETWYLTLRGEHRLRVFNLLKPSGFFTYQKV